MRKQMISDNILVARYLHGDETAFSKLLTRHQQKVFSFILIYVKDTHLANDILQETFFKVIRAIKRGEYNEQSKFLEWVLTIAHHMIMDSYRTCKKASENYCTFTFKDGVIIDILGDLDIPITSQEKLILSRKNHKTIRKLVRCLDFKLREIIILRYNLKMSYREISEILEVKINTVLGRMNLAKIRINELITLNGIHFEREMVFSNELFEEKEIFFISKQ